MKLVILFTHVYKTHPHPLKPMKGPIWWISENSVSEISPIKVWAISCWFYDGDDDDEDIDDKDGGGRDEYEVGDGDEED